MLAPYARILAPAADAGWLHCGPVGAGHFVKMIHNGIEYGMMQALAEGFALLQQPRRFRSRCRDRSPKCGATAASFVRWLLDLTAAFLARRSDLRDVAAAWSPIPAKAAGRCRKRSSSGMPVPVLSLALMARFASQGSDDYANRLLAMMRNSFGGHAIVRPDKPER